MPEQRKKGKKVISMWLQEDLLKKIDDQAASTDMPRSVVIENVLREAHGMEPLNAPAATTPVKYVRRRKRTVKEVRDAQKNPAPKKS